MLKTGAILFSTDTNLLFNRNMDNFKSNFLSQGQPGSKSIDKFFLSVLKMWLCCKYFIVNLIFVLTAWTLSGNVLITLLEKWTVWSKNLQEICLSGNYRWLYKAGWNLLASASLFTITLWRIFQGTLFSKFETGNISFN